jgi:hypothetical protein
LICAAYFLDASRHCSAAVFTEANRSWRVALLAGTTSRINHVLEVVRLKQLDGPAGAGRRPVPLSIGRPTTATTSATRRHDMSDVKDLLQRNLHEVFAERDRGRREKAAERTYTEDVRFIDPDGEVVGRQALSDRAQELLDGSPAAFVLEEDGPRYVGPGAAALAWRFGPHGRPEARGIDIITIRDGRVSVLRTLLAEPDQ